MDEISVWADMVSVTTVDDTGKKAVTVKTTGHEKTRDVVCLTAKADGTKLPISLFPRVRSKKLECYTNKLKTDS